MLTSKQIEVTDKVEQSLIHDIKLMIEYNHITLNEINIETTIKNIHYELKQEKKIDNRIKLTNSMINFINNNVQDYFKR